MCRMFCLTGNYSDDFDSIMKSFLEVTKNDPLITAKEGNFKSHDHGWGYVHHSDESINYFRSNMPVFNSTISEFSYGNLIIHARKAATGEPLGTMATHPHFESDDQYEVYLAHNGWFNKSAIAKEMSVNNYSNFVDSHMFLKYIMSFKGEFLERLNNAISRAKKKGLINSTANLMILAIDRETGKSKIYYYTDSAEGYGYTDYVKLYLVKGKAWQGVFSSSILVSDEFPKNLSTVEVKRDTINVL
jgi:predicted glutamine amidotransferase